ncbi:hypothetical protein [Pseudodesulfovibrio pelocollis]|nr:hypothetical protein [Pseudodesulfovibrio sp. SB368]
MKGVEIDGCRGGWQAVWIGNGARRECALCPDRAVWYHDFNNC